MGQSFLGKYNLVKLNQKKQKELQNVFKSNLNEISSGRNKSEEQKIALENIELLQESQEAFIKLFNDYSSIVSETKYNLIQNLKQ